jgi:hypothetical protein
MTVISSSCIGFQVHFQKAEMALGIGIAMVANCDALGLQYLLWWVQGCLFWPLQSLRKLARLMVLHLGAGSLFSISRSKFRIACTLEILSRLLAWSAFSASQTKFWWPFRFFCLAIMLLCTLSQLSFIAVFTAFKCWYWKPSLFCLHRKTQFTQEQPIWSIRRKLSSATCRKPATVCFVLWGEWWIPELIHAWSEWTRQPPPVHTKEGWMVGGHRKHFSHWEIQFRI